jgi:hypothetical protein
VTRSWHAPGILGYPLRSVISGTVQDATQLCRPNTQGRASEVRLPCAIIIINIQPLGRFWQEPEPSQETGMALAHCILGKFLGLVCHCFPLPLDVPTSAARCLYVPINASAPSIERWNCGLEWSGNFAKITSLLRHLGIFYMPQICDMGKTVLLPFRRKACWEFFRPKNPTASTESEPEILGTRGSMLSTRPPKPPYLPSYGTYNLHSFNFSRQQTSHFLVSKLQLVSCLWDF